jgi:cytochrome c553
MKAGLPSRACAALASALMLTCVGAASPSFSQLGEAVASRGVATVPPCAGCHGAAGEGNAAAGFPRLAGQPADYLSNQLRAYADGRRPNPVMTPIAAQLDPPRREAVSRHYAALAVPAKPVQRNTAAGPEADAIARGRMLATVGDDRRLVQACANCHGPDGIGQLPDYPSLGGQHASYLVNALAAWQDGSRRTDASGQMPLIAKSLGAQDIQAVAAYFAALPVSGGPIDTRAARQAVAGAQPRARTIVSGPTAVASPPQGVGTEQGAPVTGGSQGIGGTPPNTGQRNGRGTGASSPR